MQTGWSLIESANCTHTHTYTQAHGHGVVNMLVMHHIVDDQIHSDLACIPLDRDWAAYHQELKGESAGGKGEQQTAPIIYEKPALISFNMYIERVILPYPPSKEMRPPTDKSEMRGGVPHNDLLAVHAAGVPEEEMAVRSAHTHTHTPMQARWRLPQCCYSAIPRANHTSLSTSSARSWRKRNAK